MDRPEIKWSDPCDGADQEAGRKGMAGRKLLTHCMLAVGNAGPKRKQARSGRRPRTKKASNGTKIGDRAKK